MKDYKVAEAVKEPITDSFGRSFKTLRISVNDTCNLACTYCVGDNEKEGKPRSVLKPKRLSSEDFVEAVRNFQSVLNIETVRLTGGEPLLFKEIVPLVKSLKDIGISRVKMTTNGVFLKKYAGALKDAGLDSINVSLDALSEEIYYKMTRRRDLQEVLEGIDEAHGVGISLKINCVVMKGGNEDQLIPLFDFASKRTIPIRFLELMKMGPLHNKHSEAFFSEEEIVKEIGKKYKCYPMERAEGSTAKYWITDNLATFGIIANTSSPFCHDCDRLRLDSRGNIFGCLSSATGINIQDSLEDKEMLKDKLKQALSQKKTVFTGSSLSMMSIGG